MKIRYNLHTLPVTWLRATENADVIYRTEDKNKAQSREYRSGKVDENWRQQLVKSESLIDCDSALENKILD